MISLKKHFQLFRILVKCLLIKMYFQKTNSRSELSAKKCTDAGWRKIKGFGSKLGRIGEQKL